MSQIADVLVMVGITTKTIVVEIQFLWPNSNVDLKGQDISRNTYEKPPVQRFVQRNKVFVNKPNSESSNADLLVCIVNLNCCHIIISLLRYCSGIFSFLY